MATQPTQNAVPSESPRDLKFNAGKIDEFVTSMGWTYTDRFGQKHYTIEGINYLSQQAMAAYGYVILTGKTFTTGATINNPNEVLLNTADGEYYKWTGAFASGPKVVPANSTPASTGGIGPGAWIGVGDASLRAALAASDGEKLIGECPDIATLRTIEPSFDKQRITVREHTAGTRKGGGQFRAILVGSSYTDNNGTVIKTAGGAAWIRVNSDIVNPLMFGGIGDGVADDAAAVNAAGKYAKSKIDMLGLTWGVGATWFLDDTTTKTVIGFGATLKYLSGLGTTPAMRLKNKPHEIYGMNFEGGGSTTSSGLTWEGGNTGDGGKVHDCTFRYWGGSGLYVSYDGTSLAVATNGSIKNIRFIHCGNTGIANGRASLLVDGVNSFTIDGIIATECNWGIYIRNPIGVTGINRAGGNKLTNAYIKGSGQNHATFTDAQGISTSFQSGLHISNVTVTDFADNGIDMQYCDYSNVTNWTVVACKDAVFMGDRSCKGHVISDGTATDCQRAIRLVTDGTIMANAIISNIRINNIHAFNSKYHGFYIGRTGTNTQMFDVKISSCSSDSTGSYTLSTFVTNLYIEGGTNVTVSDFNTYSSKGNSIYVKSSDIVRIITGTHQNIDRAGGGAYGITIETDCNRVSISDQAVFGNSTAGAVLLAGGSGHSVKHTRWRGVANGVSSSSATSPYLLDNMAF